MNCCKIWILDMKQTTFMFFALAAICLSCSNNEKEVPRNTEVEAIVLKDTTCCIEYSYPANLEGVRDVDIYPQISGQIVSINVNEGQRVKKGQVIFKIDDVAYSNAYEAAIAEVAVAKTKVTTAQITLQSKQNLFDKGIISEYQLLLAKNDLEVAKAALGQVEARARSAKKELSFTEIRSSVDGLVGSIPFNVGSVVSPSMGKPLTTISDNSEILADFSIPENTYLELKQENTDISQLDDLTLITNLGTKYAHPGRIRTASGLISATTGTLALTAAFPNPEGLLLSGGSGKVVFSTLVPGVIAVPRASIREIQDKTFIFVIKDGVLSQKEVAARRLDKKRWILVPDENGNLPVAPGDSITAGTNHLGDGLKVTIVNKKDI